MPWYSIAGRIRQHILFIPNKILTVHITTTCNVFFTNTSLFKDIVILWNFATEYRILPQNTTCKIDL